MDNKPYKIWADYGFFVAVFIGVAGLFIQWRASSVGLILWLCTIFALNGKKNSFLFGFFVWLVAMFIGFTNNLGWGA